MAFRGFGGGVGVGEGREGRHFGVYCHDCSNSLNWFYNAIITACGYYR